MIYCYPWNSNGGIDAVHMSFTRDEDIDIIVSEPTHHLARKEVTRRAKSINTCLKVCCAGLLELNSWPQDIPLGEFGNLKVQYSSDCQRLSQHYRLTQKANREISQQNILYRNPTIASEGCLHQIMLQVKWRHFWLS